MHQKTHKAPKIKRSYTTSAPRQTYRSKNVNKISYQMVLRRHIASISNQIKLEIDSVIQSGDNVIESDAINNNEPYIPAKATLDIGDVVEILKSHLLPSLSSLYAHIRLGVVLKKITGRFAYSVCLKDGSTLGIHVDDVGFRVKGYSLRKSVLRGCGV